MTLLHLIVGSIIAILLILALHHALGRTVRPDLADREEALRRFRDLLPDEGAQGTALSRDGRCALVELTTPGRVGLLMAMGQYWAARSIDAAGIADWSMRDGTLTLALSDFTAPSFNLVFTDMAEADLWRRRLEKLRPDA